MFAREDLVVVGACLLAGEGEADLRAAVSARVFDELRTELNCYSPFTILRTRTGFCGVSINDKKVYCSELIVSSEKIASDAYKGQSSDTIHHFVFTKIS